MQAACGKSVPKKTILEWLGRVGPSSISDMGGLGYGSRATGTHLRELAKRGLVVRPVGGKRGEYAIATDWSPPPPPPPPAPPARDHELLAEGTQLALYLDPYAGCSTSWGFGIVGKELAPDKKNNRCFRVGRVGRVRGESVFSADSHSSTTGVTPNWDVCDGAGFIVKLISRPGGADQLWTPSFPSTSVYFTLYNKDTVYDDFSDFGD